MEDRQATMQPEDYTDPACPFCTDAYAKKPAVRQIPIGRIMEKLDSYYDSEDISAAERHLNYWLEEAEAGGDEGGRFTLLNERMGLYRKSGRLEEAKRDAEEAIRSGRTIGVMDRAEGGTALLNAATVYKAAGEAEKSMSLFEQAAEVYLKTLNPDDSRMGGLYNNMGLTLCDLGRYAESEESFLSAIRVMSSLENGRPEAAVSWLNLASLYEAKYGLESEISQEKIAECLEHAEHLLDSEKDRTDGNYAFVCDKCAPVFGHFGYFMTEKALYERADRIYGRT